MLLVTALVFLRSMRSAFTADLGFDTDNIALLSLEPEPGYEPGDEESTRIALAAREALTRLPGVASVTWANDPPLKMEASRSSSTVKDYQPRQGEDMEFHFAIVGPDYATTMGIPLVHGRDLTVNDRAGAPRVMLVNEAFANRFWPGQDPIGRQVSLSGVEGPWVTVVGVTRNASLVAIGESVRPYMYRPHLQTGYWGITLIVRGANVNAATIAHMRDQLGPVTPRWNSRGERTMTQQVASSIVPQRIASIVLSLFGTVALFLAAIGLYGVIAYAAAQRTHEFGIRFALGASAADVLKLVLRHGLKVLAAGAVLGIVMSALGVQALRSLLLGMNPLDPVSFVGAPVLLLLVGLTATLMPARRAARLDPLTALRTE
jgi:predicted permease